MPMPKFLTIRYICLRRFKRFGETLCCHFRIFFFFKQQGFRNLLKSLSPQPAVEQLRQKLNREVGEDKNGQGKRSQMSNINM